MFRCVQVLLTAAYLWTSAFFIEYEDKIILDAQIKSKMHRRGFEPRSIALFRLSMEGYHLGCQRL